MQITIKELRTLIKEELENQQAWVPGRWMPEEEELEETSEDEMTGPAYDVKEKRDEKVQVPGYSSKGRSRYP